METTNNEIINLHDGLLALKTPITDEYLAGVVAGIRLAEAHRQVKNDNRVRKHTE